MNLSGLLRLSQHIILFNIIRVYTLSIALKIGWLKMTQFSHFWHCNDIHILNDLLHISLPLSHTLSRIRISFCQWFHSYLHFRAMISFYSSLLLLGTLAQIKWITKMMASAHFPTRLQLNKLKLRQTKMLKFKLWKGDRTCKTSRVCNM